ncbi:hypothetical protein [Paraburkholderia sp. BL6665CI2N2]|uniref:hypothetical protein n=1 Tax=Paraburkholderia sp. BL6665CI2N2 TaxID=1938806 RepID=UPI001FB92451|nr:hypothetical protein [Paraburkholderia sp. BL6665CI2N2]
MGFPRLPEIGSAYMHRHFVVQIASSGNRILVIEPSHIDGTIAPLRESGVSLPQKNQMQILPNTPATRISFHRGYGLRASTTPTGDGLHSADLVIEQPGRPPQAFASLDLFYDHEQAIHYATVWGRIWVDSKT